MSLFDRAKFILTANAYKAGKLYSLKGHDISFVRHSNGTRVYPSGNVTEVVNNVPRLNYTDTLGILIEEPAVNLQTIQEIGALGGGQVSLESRTSPMGDISAHSLIFGSGTNDSAFIRLSEIPATPNTQYTFSFWAKNVSGNGRIGTRIATDTNAVLDIELHIATSVWARFSHTFVTDSGASYFVSPGSRFRNNNNNFGEVEIWGMQLELGSVATSYMPPNALTRAADQPESFNPVSLGYLLANEGSIVINNTVYKYTSDGNMETFIDGESQGTEAATPPTSWSLPVGETERVLMFDYPLSNIEISAL